MRNRSKYILPEEFDPIPLDPDFPIRKPDQTRRGEIPEIPPHAHDCFEIGYCFEGTGVFVVENKIFSFRPGDAVVINQQELHILSSLPGTTTIWEFTNFDPVAMLSEFIPEEENYINPLPFSGAGFSNIVDGQKCPDICHTVLEIIKELKEQKTGYRSLVRSLVWGLMVRLHRENDEISDKSKIQQQIDRTKLERIKPALHYIANHYGGKVDVSKLAELCHTSGANFRKLFHAAAGCSPQSYIHKLRMKMAGVFLSTTTNSITHISLECGFQSLSNFNRQFKEYYDSTPRQWRNNHTR